MLITPPTTVEQTRLSFQRRLGIAHQPIEQTPAGIVVMWNTRRALRIADCRGHFDRTSQGYSRRIGAVAELVQCPLDTAGFRLDCEQALDRWSELGIEEFAYSLNRG